MQSSRKPRTTAAQSQTKSHDFNDKSRGARLQKVLADSGVAARRECEELILGGAVTVNGHTVDTLPAWVDVDQDRIEVYGRPLRKAEKHVYVVLFKPRGTVCTNSDPEGRPRAIDLVQHPLKPRLYCVGRLDLDSSGLLVLTNDGEFANRLTHPRYEVHKGYDVTLEGNVDEATIARLEREIFDSGRGKRTGGSSLTLVNRDREKTVVHLELCEHRNLQIRPLMLELGFPVKKLRRTSFGPLKLKGLAVGEWRELTAKELDQLRRASRKEGTGEARTPREPRRSMAEMAIEREARAARQLPESVEAQSSQESRAPKRESTRESTREPKRTTEAPAVRVPAPFRSATLQITPAKSGAAKPVRREESRRAEPRREEPRRQEPRRQESRREEPRREESRKSEPRFNAGGAAPRSGARAGSKFASRPSAAEGPRAGVRNDAKPGAKSGPKSGPKAGASSGARNGAAAGFKAGSNRTESSRAGSSRGGPGFAKRSGSATGAKGPRGGAEARAQSGPRTGLRNEPQGRPQGRPR